MKHIFLIFKMLIFYLISDAQKGIHPIIISKNTHFADTPKPIPVDTTIALTHIYPEFDNEKNWKELIENNHKRCYYYLLTRFP